MKKENLEKSVKNKEIKPLEKGFKRRENRRRQAKMNKNG